MANSAWLNQFLAEIQRGQTGSRQQSTQEIAADIIRRSNRHKFDLPTARNSMSSSAKGSGGGKGPSNFQRVIDVLSRPLYGVAEGLKRDIQHGGLIDMPGPQNRDAEFDIFKGIGSGLAGKSKTTSKDVFEAAGLGEGKGVGGFMRNLGADIVLDPLTWVPGGVLVNLGRKGVSTLRRTKEVEEVIHRSKPGTATERVERAFNAKPKTSIPDEMLAPVRLKEPKAGTKRIPDQAAKRGMPSSRGLPEGIPKFKYELPASRAVARNTPVETPTVPAKVAEQLADVIPTPTRKFDPDALGTPPRSIPVKKKRPLDVSKAAAIETARAITQKKAPKIGDEIKYGEDAASKGGKVKLFNNKGIEIGVASAKLLREYLETGKYSYPKNQKDIPDFDVTTGKPVDPKSAEDFNNNYLFTESGSVKKGIKGPEEKFFVKTLNDAGEPVLFSVKQVRDRVAAWEKANKGKKVKDDDIVPADTTAWRSAAKDAGLTKKEIDTVLKTTDDDEALRLLREFANKPIKLPKAPAVEVAVKAEDTVVADAEDIIEAAAEGSETAAKAMAEAVDKQRPRTVNTIDAEGGEAVAKTAASVVKKIKEKAFKNPNFNPAVQVNAIRMLESALIDKDLMPGWKVGKDKLKTTSTGPIAKTRRSLMMKHLEALEDAMTHAGYPPLSYGVKNPYPLRLSDLINAAGGIHVAMQGVKHLTDLVGNQKKFDAFLEANPAAKQLAEANQAAHAAYTADLAKNATDSALEAAKKAELDPSLTASERAAALSSVPQVARDVVKSTASLPNPEAARIAAQNAKELIENAKPSVVKAIDKNKWTFKTASATGKITPETVEGAVKVEREALRKVGVSPSVIRGEVSIADDSLAQKGLAASFLKAFKPDFEMEDLRPMFVENRSLFQQHTAYWSHALNETFKSAPKAARIEGWDSFTKGLPINDPKALEASEHFAKAMDSMFGGSGLSDAITSDVLRNQITIHDLNKALKLRGVAFRFTDEITDEFGKVKKVPWMDSWKHHDLKGMDPVLFIKQMRDAADQTLMEKTMFDQIATIFSAKSGVGVGISGVPRLKGVAFDREMVPQIKRFIEVLDDLQKPRGKFRQFYEQVLRIWKTSVTIYNPSHHARNMAGDTMLAWLQGVNDPKVYDKAMRVLKSKRGLYADIGEVDNLIGPEAVKRQLAREAHAPITSFKGQKLDAIQIHTIMYNRGLLPHSRILEDIHGAPATDIKLPQPLGGRGSKAARKVSETREHFSRTAHFIHALQKSKAATLEGAIEEATRVTRKWHPDGLDLTPFEEKWMRNIFPFYSWTRKAVPLILEGAAKNPAKITAPNKVLYNLQISMGIDPESMSEPFPVDMQFPDWIRDMAYGPVLAGGTKIVGSGLNPVADVGEDYLNNPVKGLKGMLTPAVKLPAELAFKEDIQTGQEFDTMDMTEYVDKQIPGLSVANRLTGGNLGAGSVEALATGDKSAMLNHKTREGTGSKDAVKDSFLNWLIAAGIIDTQTPANIKSAQYDQRDRLAQRRKEAAGR